MIRKQVYVTAEDDAKLKRLAGQRRCTEADLVREGIGLLPDDGDRVRALLRARGLLLEPPPGPRPDPAQTAALQADLDRRLHGRNVRLTEAVLEERDEYYADPYR